MTSDEVYKLIEANGLTLHGDIEHFAALVASAEREECERGYLRLQSLMEIRETQPNKPCCLAEREACAKVCDDHCGWIPRMIGETIRARGQA